MDELRVDWLLGDARHPREAAMCTEDKWGPRIGELTYMGAGVFSFRDTFNL